MSRNRTLITVGLALMLAGWLAWKVLHTHSTLPRPVPAPQAAP